LKTPGFTKEKGVELIKLVVFISTLIFTQKNLSEFLRDTGL